MSEIYRNGRFEADDWVFVDDDAEMPAEGAVFVSLRRWMAERDVLIGCNTPIGVVVRAGEKVEDIAADINRFASLAVEFPQFTDGRGFSTARKLREEYGYEGEIRAIGDVLLDQIAFMRRCGVDAYCITNVATRAALENGVPPEVTLYYQPVALRTEIPFGTRPWVRRPGCVSVSHAQDIAAVR